MDRYISVFESSVATGYIAVVSTTKPSRLDDKIIVLNPSIFDECPSKDELRQNMTKRLKASKGHEISGDLEAICCMCIASHGYSVSHESIVGADVKSMLQVWAFLERQRVSAGYLLRQWINKHVGTRTSEGYIAHYNLTRSLGPLVCNNVVVASEWKECVDVTEDMAYKLTGQPETILNSVINDMQVASKLEVIRERRCP